MVSNNLWRSLFAPESVAVIGASNNLESWGGRVTRQLLASGNRPVYAVNPTSAEVQGLTGYESVTKIADPIDLAVIVLRAPLVATVLEECVQKKIKAALIISGGFRETGESGARLEEEIVKIARDGGIRFIGPNSMGHMDTSSHLNALAFVGEPPPGPVSLIAQSGNIGTRVMHIARRYGLGFNRFVCCGNEADILLEDYLEYFARDPNTRVIMLYIEGLRDAKRFLQLAKRITLTKPIVVMKSGGTKSSTRASQSHTGALTGSDAVYAAAFKQAGVIRVDDDEELCDVTMALLNQPLPRGNKIGILTMGGGLGVVAAETCEKEGLEIAELEPATLEKLDALLPSRWSHGNPVDLVGSDLAHSTDIMAALWILMEDRNLDAVISNSWLGRINRQPQPGAPVVDPDTTNEANEVVVKQLQQRVKEYKRTLVMVGSPPQSSQDLDDYTLYQKAGFSVFFHPHQAARTLRHLNWYRQYLETAE